MTSPAPDSTTTRRTPGGWLERLRAALGAWMRSTAPQREEPLDEGAGDEAEAPVAAPPPGSGALAAPGISVADNDLAYRQDAASHLYRLNAGRIYPGMLPPLLYAIGVLEVDIDVRGQVTGLQWLRPPRHAPEVVLEIERTVRAAAPYPLPLRLGRVTYTDTWLWDESGRFQLDTLTEGQM
ncbi:hypothetical protein [Melaminivora sp.]|uniref:hypothetical protein n=1 Tax=Melaminivora sp. TaxID=1933032 RepID=UPI0028AC7F4F|nr:hypothetical protein [Melaminivora sp.]